MHFCNSITFEIVQYFIFIDQLTLNKVIKLTSNGFLNNFFSVYQRVIKIDIYGGGYKI